MIPGEITEGRKSKLPSALQGPGQGRIIGKFQMAAHGDAIGQPGHLDLKGLQKPGDIHGGSLPLRVRVGGHDDLGDAALGHAVQQGADVQIVGAHMVHGGQHAVEHVVAAAVLAAALDGDDVTGIGYHADGGVVPFGVGTDGAQPAGGEVLAGGTKGDAALGVGDGIGEGLGLLGGQAQDVEGQTLGGFVAACSDDALQVRTDAILQEMFPSEQRATLISMESFTFSMIMIVLSPLAGIVFSVW